MYSTVLRAILPLPLLALSPAWCWGQTFFSSYADGKQFKVTIREEDVAKAPQWKADEENPPLSPRKALKFANVVKGRLVKDDEHARWCLNSIELRLVDEPKDRWVWLVSYEMAGDFKGRVPYLRLAVLMDGTVPEPTVKKME